MRKHLLISAAILFALSGCNQPNSQGDEGTIDSGGIAANEVNTAMAPDAPQDCTATEGVTKSPLFCGWKAPQNLMMPIKQPTLTVSGDYRLASRTGTVTLRKAEPQGINPKILIVDVVVDRTAGSGGHWVPVKGTFDADADQYDSVTVRTNDPSKDEISIPVDASSRE